MSGHLESGPFARRGRVRLAAGRSEQGDLAGESHLWSEVMVITAFSVLYNLNGGGQVDRAAQVLQVSLGKGSAHALQSSQRAALRRIKRAVDAGTCNYLRRHPRTVFRRAVAFQGGRGAASDKIHLHRRLRGQGIQLSRNNRASLLL